MSGITAAGFVAATEDEIFDAITAEARASISPTLDVAPDGAFGQIVGIVATKQAELWEVLEAVWGALSESGSGAALDRVAALTNSFRRAGETDAAFRIRRRQELSDQGATTQVAIRAALSKLVGMDAVRVISNRSIQTDAAGRPPKSVEALVLGSVSAQRIALTIYQNLAAGIEAYGTTLVDIADSEGYTEPIGFTVVTPANYYLRVVVEVDGGTYVGDAQLKQRLLDFSAGEVLALTDGRSVAGGVELGGTLYQSRFAAAALTVAGVVAVRQVLFKTDAVGAFWVPADLPLGPRQYLGTAGKRGFVADHVEVVT